MTYASVVSGTALASMAVITPSVLSAKAKSWIPVGKPNSGKLSNMSVLSAKANPWSPVGTPKSETLSNVDDTVDSGITQVVVNGNYYQRVDKDDTPRSNRGPCTLLGDHVYKVFEDDVEHHGIVVDSFLEKDSWIEIFQVKYDDGQTEDLYPDQVLRLDKPRRRFSGNGIAENDIEGLKEAAQDAPAKYVPFLSTHEAYDHSVSPYLNPSTGFLPDSPDSGKPWVLVGRPTSGKLRNMLDTADSGSKQVVVVTNYYQSLDKDDTPDEEDSVFSSIRDNEVKSKDKNLDEGESVAINKKQKKKKKKKKKKPKEKESTVLRKYELSIEGKQERDNLVPPTGIFDEDDFTDHHPGNIITAEDVVGKEAAQGAPDKYVPFLSSLKAYDHSVSPYSNPSSGFPPDNPDPTQKNGRDHHQHHHGHAHVGYNEGHHQKHPHLHQNPNVSAQIRESLQGFEEATTAVVISNLLHNNDHNNIMDSRATTAIGSGSGAGVTGDVIVDAGMLQTKRSLSSVGDDCDSCASRPVISQTYFYDLVYSCSTDTSDCPEGVPIGCWNTSEITNMAKAFFYIDSFDESINCWNTARVTNMNNMFTRASNFNQRLDDWNVASVTAMVAMFASASNFNQPLDDWDVASVTNMYSMFNKASNFNQPLDDWNVASVTNMDDMFHKARNFNQSLNDWNVGSVTTMYKMFYEATNFNQSLNDWNVASVTDVAEMFRNAINFDQPIDDWNVASVTNMNGMFETAQNFNQPVDDWNVASVQDMNDMFYKATDFNQPLDDWDVSSVTDMSRMFRSTNFNQSLNDWNVATNFNQPLDDWDVASVTDMYAMFQGATTFNQCLSSWAGKALSDVDVDSTFDNTSCPDKDPVVNVAPWCQTEEQCSAQSQSVAPSAASASPTSAPSASPTSAPTIALPTAGPIALPTAGPIVPPLAPTTNGDTIDSLRKTISDLEASSLATIESLEESIESLEESIVQKDLIIANLSLQIENMGAGPVALPTEVPTAGPIALPTAGPIAKQKKTSKKSKK